MSRYLIRCRGGHGGFELKEDKINVVSNESKRLCWGFLSFKKMLGSHACFLLSSLWSVQTLCALPFPRNALWEHARLRIRRTQRHLQFYHKCPERFTRPIMWGKATWIIVLHLPSLHMGCELQLSCDQPSLENALKIGCKGHCLSGQHFLISMPEMSSLLATDLPESCVKPQRPSEAASKGVSSNLLQRKLLSWLCTAIYLTLTAQWHSFPSWLPPRCLQARSGAI